MTISAESEECPAVFSMHKIGNFSEFLRGKIGNFSATSIPL